MRQLVLLFDYVAHCVGMFYSSGTLVEFVICISELGIRNGDGSEMWSVGRLSSVLVVSLEELIAIIVLLLITNWCSFF